MIAAGTSAPHPSQWIATARPTARPPSAGSGTKKRTLMFCGGRSRTTGLPVGDPFALPIHRVEHASGLRRRRGGLAEPPRGLLESRARRGDLRRLRFQLFAAAAGSVSTASALCSCRTCAALAACAARLSSSCWRDIPPIVNCASSRVELRCAALQVGLRLRELRARDVLLLRPLALAHVGKARFRLSQIFLRLALRGCAIDGLENE